MLSGFSAAVLQFHKQAVSAPPWRGMDDAPALVETWDQIFYLHGVLKHVEPMLSPKTLSILKTNLTGLQMHMEKSAAEMREARIRAEKSLRGGIRIYKNDMIDALGEELDASSSPKLIRDLLRKISKL